MKPHDRLVCNKTHCFDRMAGSDLVVGPVEELRRVLEMVAKKREADGVWTVIEERLLMIHAELHAALRPLDRAIVSLPRTKAADRNLQSEA